MCAAPCAVVASRGQVQWLGAGASALPVQQPAWQGQVLFHAGRLLGYGALGVVAAVAMEQVAWFSDRSSWLHPVWVSLHLVVLAWGLLMLFQGQQPRWLEVAGRSLWGKVQPLLHMRGGTLVAGLLWAMLPCGLLYSAVLMAALSGSAWAGGFSMVAFGVGSGLWLWVAPWVLAQVGGAVGRWRAEWGVRLAGLMLVAVALAALWMDVVRGPQMWCR